MSAPSADAETAMLLDHLGAQRRHVLGILEGLDDDALTRPVLPSGWSCLQLVHHLATDDERFWFRAVVAGEQDMIDGLDGDGWAVPDGMSAVEVLALYRAESDRSDAILRRVALDAPPAWWPDFFPEGMLADVRDVVLHVIGETATHAGHLDAVRELIDGRTWLVLK